MIGNMWHFILHIAGIQGGSWLNFWGGIAGSCLVTIVAWFVHRSNERIHRKLNAHHAQMKDMLDPTTPGGITDAVDHLKKHTEEQLDARLRTKI